MAKTMSMTKKLGHAIKKRTSIGMSVRSRPKHKSAKVSFKRYRGQGK